MVQMVRDDFFLIFFFRENISGIEYSANRKAIDDILNVC
jgi:hypothetical protein